MKKGEKMSQEMKDKLSKIHKGRPSKLKGIKFSEERKKTLNMDGLKKGWGWNRGLVGFMSGEKNSRWISDRTKLQRYAKSNLDRRSSTYRDWRINIYKRDSYLCKINNKDCCGKIVAHHILSYTRFPELRYDINNGITLCKFHHPRKRVDENRLISFFQKIIS